MAKSQDISFTDLMEIKSISYKDFLAVNTTGVGVFIKTNFNSKNNIYTIGKSYMKK